MLIPGADAYLGKSSRQCWLEELANTRAMLAKLDTDIAALKANQMKSYTLDTGQTRQTVQRDYAGDLRLLLNERGTLLGQIGVLESRRGVGGSGAFRVAPSW